MVVKFSPGGDVDAVGPIEVRRHWRMARAMRQPDVGYWMWPSDHIWRIDYICSMELVYCVDW
jgi:hypothetical protein